MGLMKVNVSAIFLLLFLASRSDVKAENVVFDVTKYGNEEDICKVSSQQYNIKFTKLIFLIKIFCVFL